MSRRHRGLAEGQPALSEPYQDPGDVVWFSATARQGERLSFGGIITYQSIRDGTQPWRRHRQSADAVCTNGRVCRSGYYQLRQLQPLIRSMSSDAVTMLVQAVISCRMDYCNSLFYGISDGMMTELQSTMLQPVALASGSEMG